MRGLRILRFVGAQRPRQHRRGRAGCRQPRRRGRHPRAAGPRVLCAGPVTVPGIYRRRGAHGDHRGIQRAAQDRGGTARTPDLHIRHHRTGEGTADDSVAHSSLPVPAAAAAHYAGVARADLRAGGRRRRRCGVPVGDPGRRRFPTGYALGAGPIAGWGRGHPRDLHPGAGAAGCHRRRPDRRRGRRTGRLRCGRIVRGDRIGDRWRT
ncbi:Uncharacterised protein [Mycobacterium tuberculosis]|uniref:Uncharacterized protein n=1 Tax=Mycobacterium tuberculosis TaxID=1773 RepID=A0A654ZT46_MYCTX|nr:Uncharacterised protein [Mycobacterium tuberculosis]